MGQEKKNCYCEKPNSVMLCETRKRKELLCACVADDPAKEQTREFETNDFGEREGGERIAGVIIIA